MKNIESCDLTKYYRVQGTTPVEPHNYRVNLKDKKIFTTMKNRIFLGGTCAETTWRSELIPMLRNFDCEWFNPVVDDWTPECQAIEEDEKNNKCNVHLYVITSQMIGVYSIAEIINSCWQAQCYGPHVNKVAFFVLDTQNGEWNESQKRSFKATINMCYNIAPERFCGCFVKDMKDVVATMCDNGILIHK